MRATGGTKRHLVAAAVCIGLVLWSIPYVAAAKTNALKGTLTFAMVSDFTGPTSYDGGAYEAGCYPAAAEINHAGGLLGHKILCKIVDTRGDPADAVPAVYAMLSSTKNLVGAMGPGSNTSPTVLPILKHAKIPTMDDGGSTSLNHTTDPYFWRNIPADGVMGWGMSAYARQRDYHRIALVFQNSTGAQGAVPAVLHGAKVLGLDVVSKLTLIGDSSSYSTEAARVIQSNPQAILTESDPQTAATFFRDLIQAGHFYPVIGTSNIMVSPYLHAVGNVIGVKRLTHQLVGVNFVTPTTQPGFKVWEKWAKATKSQIPATIYTLHLQYNESPYDGMMVMALAMDETHSTKGAVYDRAMLKIFNGTRGAVDVSSYAQGKKLISEGKAIRWDGAEGLQKLNKYHSTTGNLETQGSTANETVRVAGRVNGKYLTEVSKQ